MGEAAHIPLVGVEAVRAQRLVEEPQRLVVVVVAVRRMPVAQLMVAGQQTLVVEAPRGSPRRRR